MLKSPYMSNHWKVVIRCPIIVEQPCVRKPHSADYWKRAQLIISQHSQQENEYLCYEEVSRKHTNMNQRICSSEVLAHVLKSTCGIICLSHSWRSLQEEAEWNESSPLLLDLVLRSRVLLPLQGGPPPSLEPL